MSVKSPVYKRKNEQGFALLEALLALFLLTIGILGVAGLQIQSMQSGSIAMQRLMVAMKTQELVERMLTNPGLTTVTITMSAASTTATSTSATAGDVDNYAAAGAGQDNGCYNPLVACTPLQMAQHDVNAWITDLNAVLPQDPVPTYTISQLNRTVTITVAWEERGNALSYTVTTQVQPLVVVNNGT